MGTTFYSYTTGTSVPAGGIIELTTAAGNGVKTFFTGLEEGVMKITGIDELKKKVKTGLKIAGVIAVIIVLLLLMRKRS